MSMSLDELAGESGATLDEIEKFLEVGVIDSLPEGRFTWADLQRVRAVKQFLDAGVGWAHMRRAIEEGLITFQYADAFFLEPAASTGRTFGEFKASLGARAGQLARVYDALGLAEPPAERPLRRDEERCLEQLIDLWTRVGGTDALLRATRLLGDHVRALADGWMAIWIEHMRYVGVEPTNLEERARLTLDLGRGLTDLLPRIMVWAEQRYLERAMTEVGVEQMEEALAARGIAPAPVARLPAVLFVDLVGFSRLTEQHGDEAAVAFNSRLREVADRAARRHDGKLVKLLGDGAMLHFADADDAVAAGRWLLTPHGWDKLLPDPHIGLHAGPVIERDGDLFGTTVNIAARLSGAAGPRELIASTEAVEALNRPHEATLEPLGKLSLRNIGRPIDGVRITVPEGTSAQSR